jgi:hypothetical protein
MFTNILTLRTTRTPVLALALVLVSVGTAQAKDLCLTFSNAFTGYTFVGKQFSIPGKNRCKPFNGFTLALGESSLLSGTGCTSADGSTFSLQFTAQVTTFNEFRSFLCGFNRPTRNGACSGLLGFPNSPDNELNTVPALTATVQECTVDVP